tara:strand:- start:288 stop:869 length:582 start_codon:yes stop_codon:yes gene_type:complete
MNKGKLIILTAPSGTGKTSICRELLKRNKDWTFSVSVTTRPERKGEIDGKDYIFMDSDKFEHHVKFGEFIEWEWVHGYKYGTLFSTIDEAIEQNKILILDVDVKGGESIIEEYEDDCITFFVEPPGDNLAEKLEILEERLNSRGNENSTLIKRRLQRVSKELEFKDNFQHHIVNENLKEATDNIESIIKEELK